VWKGNRLQSPGFLQYNGFFGYLVTFIHRLGSVSCMAKTDHFYIRALVNNATAPFEQTEIDLGSFVDALGKSVLRVHSISVQATSIATPGSVLGLAASRSVSLHWQLTTQTQTDTITLDDKSVISMGSMAFANTVANAGNLTSVTEIGDRVDQKWEDGYLVAVEQIFFGMEGGANANWSVALSQQ
jgi:hypothetical protein